MTKQMSADKQKAVTATILKVANKVPEILGLDADVSLPETPDDSIVMRVVFQCKTATLIRGMKGMAEDHQTRKTIENAFESCGVSLSSKDAVYKSMKMYYTVEFTVPEVLNLLIMDQEIDTLMNEIMAELKQRQLNLPPASAVQLVENAKQKERNAPIISPFYRPVRANIDPGFSHSVREDKVNFLQNYMKSDASFLRRYALSNAGLEKSENKEKAKPIEEKARVPYADNIDAQPITYADIVMSSAKTQARDLRKL